MTTPRRGGDDPRPKGPARNFQAKRAGPAPNGPKVNAFPDRKPRLFERPPLRPFNTTLWEYPSQHYNDSLGRGVQGDKNYAGATPSWVIWQVIQRYTREGDTVLDPMCGSGTTLDVCEDTRRRAVAFDLAPARGDIRAGDAREIDLPDASVDLVFLDPPYSTHIAYSDHPDCIGRLDAGESSLEQMDGQRVEMHGRAYYEAMEEVIAECERVLRPGGHLALYVSDSLKPGKRRGEGLFMPIGFELFSIMRDYLQPVDVVCVVRHNHKLAKGNWKKSAEESGFFLRGFNYLLIMRKAAMHAR
ncbi:MAG: DNA methyltransferase [Phycisphaerales bacterium]|nr:DNA methyltransferase [Phycisphaerales bacterium]